MPKGNAGTPLGPKQILTNGLFEANLCMNYQLTVFKRNYNCKLKCFIRPIPTYLLFSSKALNEHVYFAKKYFLRVFMTLAIGITNPAWE